MIVIVRHGVAEDSFDNDINRELTEQGKADIRKRADYLRSVRISELCRHWKSSRAQSL